jgi:hypothetical protein
VAEAQTLFVGEKELAASNTPEQLTTESTIITALSVKAKTSNLATIRVGPSTLGATAYPLAAGQSLQFDVIDPVRIYLYGKEHDGVNFLGLHT